MTTQDKLDSTQFKLDSLQRQVSRGDHVPEIIEKTRKETIKMILAHLYDEGLIEFASYDPETKEIKYARPINEKI